MAPVTIYKRVRQAEAYHYTGENAAEIVAWSAGHAYVAEGGHLYITTDRGDVVADPGDYIIHGLVGEWYPIGPDAYAAGWREHL